jgi:hypothetical protein
MFTKAECKNFQLNKYLGGCRSGCKIIIDTAASSSSRRHQVFRLYSAASVPPALRGITPPLAASKIIDTKGF